MSKTISLKFLKNHGPYIKDSIATFPVLIGQDMIKKKVAVEYVEETATVDNGEHKPKKTKPADRQAATKSIITK